MAYPLGCEFAVLVQFLDGRRAILHSDYFTSPRHYPWWMFLRFANDDENPSAEREGFPNVTSCAWPSDLVSLLDCPVRGTVND